MRLACLSTVALVLVHFDGAGAAAHLPRACPGVSGFDRSREHEPAQGTGRVRAGERLELRGGCPEAALQERLNALINQAPVMLFMKGEPDAPQCGFSRLCCAGKHASGFTALYPRTRRSDSRTGRLCSSFTSTASNLSTLIFWRTKRCVKVSRNSATGQHTRRLVEFDGTM